MGWPKGNSYPSKDLNIEKFVCSKKNIHREEGSRTNLEAVVRIVEDQGVEAWMDVVGGGETITFLTTELYVHKNVKIPA